MAVAARPIAAAGGEDIPQQYRVLVLLAARGSQRPADLAAALAVNPSTVSRMCVTGWRKGLVRHVVRVTLKPSGRELVDTVTRHRRCDLAASLARLSSDQRQAGTGRIRRRG